jgi:arabinose-5-phosphate isomerase
MAQAGGLSATPSTRPWPHRGAPGRTIVTGMGKSGHVARKIAATMASTGTPAYFVHPGEASHGDLGMIRQEDVILALSWSGETAELADIITYAKRFAIPLIAITSSADSALGRQADVACAAKVRGGVPQRARADHVHDDATRHGRCAGRRAARGARLHGQRFPLFHPGGKLGASLSFVRDVMHAGERCRSSSRMRPMGEAILKYQPRASAASASSTATAS